MPVGSEWWGATQWQRMGLSLLTSPMPVGSEWWGADGRKSMMVTLEEVANAVANACRQ